ncbi:MAG: hypothetical protein DIAAKJNI_00561 [Candidatus Argoarchaeum ethanivorans]|uniref:Uncharacterized protein n=1 Tax=Candidatus Argoarchaeum ethanivorans TaxID=2608793 RepID=A0A811TDU0_9EURY|nr:MAG: hypothetical protein DIAAKJNI_00561 [Candidatus Argoarchaeum ethanivorans]
MPVVDARIYRVVGHSRTPVVVLGFHIVGLIVVELVFVTLSRGVVYAVHDNIIILNRVARASVVQPETIHTVVLHPVADDGIVA